MKKILEYGLGLLCWLNALSSFAVEKFEVLPDLPDPLAAYAQTAEASSVSGGLDSSILDGGQAIGHEPSIISVVLSLLIVILLIYITGILYAKLNKINSSAMRKQHGTIKSQASVISTTALGNNKTLHVIELDGKRMLIGASSNAIQLIKDLGNVSEDGVEEEFSSIEIPTIKIPKIEIPKIEIPSMSFSKLATKIHKDLLKNGKASADEPVAATATETKEQNDKKTEENSEGIIDSLFTQPQPELVSDAESPSADSSEHIVDPDDYALYKKYLG